MLIANDNVHEGPESALFQSRQQRSMLIYKFRMLIYAVLLWMPRNLFTGRNLSLTVRPSVRPFFTFQYRLCVINFSYSFQWIFFKSCKLYMDVMKMCMWGIDGDKLIFYSITAF